MTELRFADYGQLKEPNCTDEEIIIYEILCSVTGADDLECVRRTDKYVSAAIGETDVARFKFTPRAKWIWFPYVGDKIKLASPTDVERYAEDAIKAVQTARQING